MPWSLEIHHIDVGQGESTLIVARSTDALGAVTQTRSMLVDGGLYTKARNVHNYLNTQAIANLNVMVASHYDLDHFNGLRYLINNNNARYNNTLIIDQGEQGNVDHQGRILNRENPYLLYTQAILQRGLTRYTANVTTSPNAPAPWVRGDWLLGQELLWRNAAGLAIPIPTNAPTVRCVAVNQYIRKRDGTSTFVFGGLSLDTKNSSSIGLLVTFNNFRYFTAGDLESTQEDVLGPQLNNGGVVNAFKAGHHGSQYSTSSYFVNKLSPSAAFISCGATNNFNGVNHPTQQAIDHIDGVPTVQNFYLTACGYPRNHVPASQNPPASQLLSKARVAGGIDTGTGNHVNGDIVLSLNQAQSLNNPSTFDVTYWEEEAVLGVQGNQTINH